MGLLSKSDGHKKVEFAGESADKAFRGSDPIFQLGRIWFSLSSRVPALPKVRLIGNSGFVVLS